MITPIALLAQVLSDRIKPGLTPSVSTWKEAEEIIKALGERGVELMMWRPIAEAPQDGFFLVYEDEAQRTMMRDRKGWKSPAYAVRLDSYGYRHVITDAVICDVIHEPTHYMTLPSAPKVTP